MTESPFLGVDHLVFLTRDIESAIDYWSQSMELHTRLDHSEQGVSQAFFTMPDGSFVELVAPSHSKSPVAKLIDDNGGGLYVLAMQVEDLEEAQAMLKRNGATLIGEGTERVFVKPASPMEPLIQLWPKDRAHRWRDAQS